MKQSRLMLLLSGLFISHLSAGTITEVTSGTLHNSSTTYAGQSFFTPAGGPWYDITFNFLADSTPFAAGTAFLLSQKLTWSLCCGDPPPIYTPLTLDATAPGFIAASIGIVNGQYVFDPSVTLQPSTLYYLYENGVIPSGTISGGDNVACCVAYFADASSAYFPSFASANFQVSGSVVPEPGTAGLISLGLLAFLHAGRRGKRERKSRAANEPNGVGESRA